ncbi:MAG TPA: hypothetical protein VFZ65_10065 [Planctomycetota bacterium]|nr:hypothetical protein [Planctomycetota bacterium]
MLDLSKFKTPACPMPIAVALRLASQQSGRSIDDVRRAEFVSSVALEARLAEEPAAARLVKRFEPHWRIHFAGYEGVVDEGDGPTYMVWPRGPTDDLLVFEDGSTMTFREAALDA